MQKTIKERKMDEEFVAEQRSAAQEVEEAKKEIQNDVKIKRARMKKVIQSMQQDTRMRKAALQNELNSLRMKMSQEALEANKTGDIKKCSAGKKSKSKRKDYCDENFIVDYMQNQDCNSDEFCYMCCEHEFGSSHMDKREACYNMCDLKDEKKEEKKVEKNGPWIWTPKKKE